MHTPVSINDQDIAKYMPTGIPDSRIESIWELTGLISEAVAHQIPVGLSCHNNPRLILPHSIFLQHRTPSGVPSTIKPNIRTRMRHYSKGARQAIGMDAYQLFSQSDESRDGWKTFHLDRIDDDRLMTPEEIRQRFGVDNQIDDDTHLIDGFTTIGDFVRNWNYPFRTFFVQSPSNLDLKVTK